MPATLSPHDFAAKWRVTRTKERSAAQEHFIDLCRLLGVPTPNEGDPTGETYAFEKGANKQLGGQGWADVWKRDCFGWEYKGKDADLDKAYRQLQQYRESLQNPPLLITCDLERILIHTNFTNTVKRVIEITLDDIEHDDWVLRVAPTPNPSPKRGGELRPLALLRLIFTEYKAEEHPLRPEITTEKVTQEAARLFGEIAREMQKYGEQPQATAHFLIRVLFCLFAEDIGLLPANLMREMVTSARNQPRPLANRMTQLFEAMRAGGLYGNHDIRHFNGGLFDGNAALELEGNAMLTLQQVSGLDWSAVEPSIFGTLFERGLDPAKRAQLGAHYTDRSDIALIVEPVLMAPLRREWAEVQAKVNAILPSPVIGGGGTSLWEAGGGGHTRAGHQRLAEANDLLNAFHDKLAGTRVLDPACGSGNFLYVALRALLSLEKEIITFCDALGLPRPALKVSPEQLFGIELNPYAHELAQATVWIGYIQWRHENGFGDPDDPILRKLDNIQNRDAIMLLPSPAIAGEGPGVGVEPDWPAADVIIGNPPFLGGKRLRSELGDDYVNTLFKLYEGRVPHEADLVCYWFEKARAQIERGKTKRAGLIATQGIRGGANRKVLEHIKSTGDIFYAWSDRDWILNGATVHVSIIGFDNGNENLRVLNDAVAISINSNLTTSVDTTIAKRLAENERICFMGDTKGGAFDISGTVASRMLNSYGNPNGKDNSEVIKKWINASDITQGNRGMWIIDFGVDMSEEDASQYELPFEYVKQAVKPARLLNKRTTYRDKWWIHAEPRPALRNAISKLYRYIVTPGVSKHRVFVWIDSSVLSDHAALVFARDDDYFLGVLQSRLHEAWSRIQGTQLREAESGFRYTPETTFETFPFPWPPAHEPQDEPRVQAIAQAARELVEKRDRWLAEGASAIDPAYLAGVNVAKKPKKSEARTLTNLYNQRPTWLDLAHQKLDRAVLAAYGWPHDLSDEEILSRLLALNVERANFDKRKAS